MHDTRPRTDLPVVSRVLSSRNRTQRGGKLRLIRGAWMLALLLLGGAYLALPTGNAFPYFGFFSPPSMLQSTVPLTDSSNIVTAIGWLSNHTQPGSVLMTHNAFYGW